jgi:hypothetical protein
MAKWSWKNSPELMNRLIAAQNRNTSRDIVSFAGFCESEDELRAYVERHEIAGNAGCGIEFVEVAG